MLSMAEWKKISDFNYSISSFGRVRNDKTGRILKGSANSCGYLQVQLYKEEKKQKPLIHRLMAPFLDNPYNYSEIDHIDQNKSNNHISNLRFVTRSENCRNKSKQQNKTSRYIGVNGERNVK
jgi:hypothetical protein